MPWLPVTTQTAPESRASDMRAVGVGVGGGGGGGAGRGGGCCCCCCCYGGWCFIGRGMRCIFASRPCLQGLYDVYYFSNTRLDQTD